MQTKVFTLHLAAGSSTTITRECDPNRASLVVADILSRRYVIDDRGDFINCPNIVKISLFI